VFQADVEREEQQLYAHMLARQLDTQYNEAEAQQRQHKAHVHSLRDLLKVPPEETRALRAGAVAHAAELAALQQQVAALRRQGGDAHAREETLLQREEMATSALAASEASNLMLRAELARVGGPVAAEGSVAGA
jgi:chromosome segregation ATPase